MKTTPIYILLLIFFLNFDLAWGMLRPAFISTPYLIQTQYSLSEIDKSYFQSLNIVCYLDTSKYFMPFEDNTTLLSQRLRLNIGISKVLAELDYELGLKIATFRKLYIMPFISTGTNIYSYSYGGGIEFHYLIKNLTKSRFEIVGNLNYRITETLFGHTEANQWYQNGFGAKIGVEFEMSFNRALPKIDYDDY